MLTPLRRLAGRAWRWADRRTLNEEAFRRVLRELGVVPGAIVLVHSSMDVLARRVPSVGPMRIIQLLQELVSEQGTLLMPALPFSGRQLTYVESGPIFDVQRTGSKAGLLTEIFRRLPGVVRSRHPVTSVSAWGARARELTADHHRGTSFGETSPYLRLARLGGLEVGLGTPFWATFSLLHVAEELDPVTRDYAYDPQPRPLTIVDSGNVQPFEHRPLRADRDRDFARLEQTLLADGTLRSLSRQGLPCQVASGQRLIDRGLELIHTGHFWFGPLPR